MRIYSSVLLIATSALTLTSLGCLPSQLISQHPQAAIAANIPLKPGRYCYQRNEPDLKANIRVNIDSKGQIRGDTQATITNAKESYYSSYLQKITGSLVKPPTLPALAKLNVITWIEYDVQTQSQTWVITPQSLKVQDQMELKSANCALVSKAFQNEKGIEAADLTGSATAVHTKRIRFKPGDRAATVESGVIRAERDVYLLNARGGQSLTVEIKSLESNAVFDVVSPSGLVLAQESTQKKILLPHTGDYQVIVGGTRGNASYTLKVRID